MSPFNQAPASRNFNARVESDLETALVEARRALPSLDAADVLRVDLHCHDRNSDVPDETLGRLLRLPETWLPTKELVRTLRRHGSDVVTVTNHNNARSCWDLLDKGEDVLVGAEFSCTIPDAGVGVHVLTFGFTPGEEEKLQALRKDIYKFQAFALERNLPTVLAHPLHFYAPGKFPDVSIMDRFALLFERFEALNGQRDSWQNLLTLEWVRGMDEERLESMERRLGLRASDFCRNPFVKKITGGSDCHFGMFAGATGTLIAAPGWRQSRRKPSEIALEGLRDGRIAPFGVPCAEEKLTAAFLEYFSQSALRMEDPGLVRLLLHKGEPGQKLNAFMIGNGLMELRRHRRTSRFLKVFSRGLRGKRPAWWMKVLTSKDYKPLLADIDALAIARKTSPEANIRALREVLPRMFHTLQEIFLGRLGAKLRPFTQGGPALSFADALEKFELPIHFRSWTEKKKPVRAPHTAESSLGNLTDGLPFPLLASTVLGGATYATHAVLNDRRAFVDHFAARTGRGRPAGRVLWLTDTLFDKNGVSHALQATLEEVRRRNLPVDFFACDVPAEKAGEHLVSLPSVETFRFPFYPDQPLRVPDLLQVQKLFQDGGYDRILCSTEAPMGAIALYLKHAFGVPAHFYVHTDWMDFARRNADMDIHQSDRLRRILRAFYGAFDGLFLLNTEQRDLFASPEFGLPREKLHLTAHWTRPEFVPRTVERAEVLPGVRAGAKVLLFAGRLSAEKGLRDLPQVLADIRRRCPEAVLAFAGTGPLEEELKEKIPDAVFLGWMDPARLAAAFAAADLLLLPSWFDTFSCVLLEAMACGLPAIAYDTKGPRDLILNGVCGFHAGSPEAMAFLAAEYLTKPHGAATFRRAAVERAAQFEAGPLMDRLLQDCGLRLPILKAHDAPAFRREPVPSR
ncbi:MAG: glycosyltransferase [Fibrobacteria bacterium]|nr:glycosyltransferase [Fibrobacteria bacterium]